MFSHSVSFSNQALDASPAILGLVEDDLGLRQGIPFHGSSGAMAGLTADDPSKKRNFGAASQHFTLKTAEALSLVQPGLHLVQGLGLEPRTNWLKANCSTN